MFNIFSKTTNIILGGFVALFIFWLGFLNHVDINEVGIAYNSRTGELHKQNVGWHVTPPWVKTSALPTIPLRVEVYSGTTMRTRFILPKLVQFKPDHLEEFVKTEGFKWYGASSIELIFAQYAFSGKKWSFLEEVKIGEE